MDRTIIYGIATPVCGLVRNDVLIFMFYIFSSNSGSSARDWIS